MVVDTSALVAVLPGEPAAERLLGVLDSTPNLVMSAAALVEASMVMYGRSGDDGVVQLDLLLDRADIDVIDVSREHALLARAAFTVFGKGHHPAALNFGDCFSYALAVDLREALLFVGDDFARTDVLAAKY